MSMMLSQTVKTDGSWLQAYQVIRGRATPEERAHDDREHYRHSSQIYPDYLDYQSEWEFVTTQMLEEARESFIRRLMNKRIPIRCVCKERHYLVRHLRGVKPGSDEVEVDSPHLPNADTCWWQTIDREIKSLKFNLSRGLMNFPTPISKILVFIMNWKSERTETTPMMLPYEVYKEVWWSLNAEGQDTQLSTVLRERMSTCERALIHSKLEGTKVPKKARYFFSTRDILEDHSFHVFITAVKNIERGVLLKWMNLERRKIGLEGENLKTQEIERAIARCQKCKGEAFDMSIFGIYCAFPGSGKTTAQERGALVGFDTDWIGLGPTWLDYSMLLRKEIPIITNQIHTFDGSGVKIQLMLKKSIRLDSHGRPMGNYDEALAHGKRCRANYVVHLLKEKEFVEHYALRVQAAAHMQLLQMIGFINHIQELEDDPRWMSEYGRRVRKTVRGQIKHCELENIPQPEELS